MTEKKYRERYKEHRREYDRIYYAEHKEERAAYSTALRAKNRARIIDLNRRRAAWSIRWVKLLRATQGCDDCGTHDGWLDYHHIDPLTKRKSVSSMANYGVEALVDEIAKCTVLCRSCHKKRHAAMARTA